MGGGIGQGGNSSRGSLTVSARVSNGASRYAMPTIPGLVYAALLYHGDSPEEEKFEPGTITTDADGNTGLVFSFQRPDDTSGTFTLEVFAFKKGTAVADFSRAGALLSGYKDGLNIDNDSDEIQVSDPIALSSVKPGSVSLKVTVPEGCSLTIDDARFTATQDENASDTYIVSASGMSAGAYPVTFNVKKGAETVHVFTESINVINGLCTDTWSGQEKGEAKVITQSAISSTVFVRGESAPWYASNAPSATAGDENSGSYLAPLATIQKAVDKIIAINDGTSTYTIYLDGTFTATSSAALADFAAPSLTQKLSVKIAGLSASEKAVLDGGGTACGIVVGSTSAQKDVNLSLENLVITDGKSGGNGGGVFFNGKTIEMTGCEVVGCEANNGGGVYIGSSGTFTMNNGEISNCMATNNGGGVYITLNGTFEMSGTAKITGCKTTSTSDGKGGGVFVAATSSAVGTFTMSGAASIPSGYDGKNDVYLSANGENVATITVAGDLTAATPVATITPSAYAARQVLSADGSNVPAITQDICDKFALTPDPDGADWKIVPDGVNGVLKTTTFYAASTGSDTTGDGTKAKPFATIQKAVDTVIAQNDGTSAYTIYVDGTLQCDENTYIGADGMANFSALDKSLTLTIKALSGTATLDANKKTRVIYAYSASGALDLTLENLTITGGYTSSGGGGIYFHSTGGTLAMKSGTISANTASTFGGGVYVYSGMFTMEGGTIGGETADNGNTAQNGGGVFATNNSTFEMSGGTISGNKATTQGSGVYINASSSAVGTFNMSGAAQILEDNDVYLVASGSNIATITVAGSLSETKVATITLSASSYTANRQVLSAGTGVTITQDVCDKFKMKDMGRIKPYGSTKGVLYWKIGDKGSGGGLVCYYDANGFSVNSKTCYYLECSKNSLGSIPWSPSNALLNTSDGIGSGSSNTWLILNAHSNATASNCAAKACAQYSTGTTMAGEWFLPSPAEAMKIYNIAGITGTFWTSRSQSMEQAYYVMNASSSAYSNKTGSRDVRAVRAF